MKISFKDVTAALSVPKRNFLSVTKSKKEYNPESCGMIEIPLLPEKTRNSLRDCNLTEGLTKLVQGSGRVLRVYLASL